MIIGLFGNPGSGKSYYAVTRFIVDRLDTDTIISNIALSKDINLGENYRYLEKLDMDNLHNKIKVIVSNTFLSHDEKKVELATLFDSFLIDTSTNITLLVDECHLYGYRGTAIQIAHIDGFLSIHRHIYEDRRLDIVLITQVPGRLNSVIAEQIELAIRCLPSTKRLSSKVLEYEVYGSVDGLKKKDAMQRLRRELLPAKSRVFELYQSGFKIKGDPGFRKKLLMLVFVIVLFASYMVYNFYGLITGRSLPLHKQEKIDVEKVAFDSNVTDTNLTISRPYNIVCRVVPLAFDAKKVKNWFYTETFISKKGDKVKQICYKDFIDD